MGKLLNLFQSSGNGTGAIQGWQRCPPTGAAAQYGSNPLVRRWRRPMSLWSQLQDTPLALVLLVPPHQSHARGRL